MQRINYTIKRLQRSTLKELLRYGISLASGVYRNIRLKIKDNCLGTFIKDSKFVPELHFYFPAISAQRLHIFKQQIFETTHLFLIHRFDILGSGWVNVKHGMHCMGVEGHRFQKKREIVADSRGNWLEGRINEHNILAAKKIWRLIDCDSLDENKTPYIPIDWHLDFKSGYRWLENIWYKDIKYGKHTGADVKVPRELSRMHHLTQFAWAYALAENNLQKTETANDGLGSYAKNDNLNWEKPDRYLREFRNQVLDFISTNPPRYGVNWQCTMDVSIRVANWLVAYDIFVGYGASFDEAFLKIFVKSVYEHGLHIVNNLEWNDYLVSNHYLSNIGGLLFVSAYLPRNRETDAWLAFAVQELVKETQTQFLNDGANFEASTSYHGLSAEIVLYSTAIVLSLSPEKLKALRCYDASVLNRKPNLAPSPCKYYPLPSSHFDKLRKMAEFTMQITKPNNTVVQIGDNDSGRFFKLQPVYELLNVGEAKKRYLNLSEFDESSDETDYFDENCLDHRHLVAAFAGMFDAPQFERFAGNGWVEKEIIRRLVKEKFVLQKEVSSDELLTATACHNQIKIMENETSLIIDEKKMSPTHITQMNIPGDDIRIGLNLFKYQYFGLYIYRSRRIFLAVRCGDIGQNGNGGHAHNDQLAIELNVDGVDWIRDPGTYLYTPLPLRRNQFRSVAAHFGPRGIRDEPEDLCITLFSLSNTSKSNCLCFTEETFLGELKWKNNRYLRQVLIEDNKIMIKDFDMAQQYNQNAKTMVVDEDNKYKWQYFSSGYGKIEYTPR